MNAPCTSRLATLGILMLPGDGLCDLSGLAYVGLGSRCYYLRETTRLGLGVRQWNVHNSQGSLRVENEMQCPQRKWRKPLREWTDLGYGRVVLILPVFSPRL